MLPFLGDPVTEVDTPQIDTKVYVKPTNSRGALLVALSRVMLVQSGIKRVVLRTKMLAICDFTSLRIFILQIHIFPMNVYRFKDSILKAEIS